VPEVGSTSAVDEVYSTGRLLISTLLVDTSGRNSAACVCAVCAGVDAEQGARSSVRRRLGTQHDKQREQDEQRRVVAFCRRLSSHGQQRQLHQPGTRYLSHSTNTVLYVGHSVDQMCYKMNVHLYTLSSCHINNSGEVVHTRTHTCPCVTKQCDLVPVNGRCCSVAGKV